MRKFQVLRQLARSSQQLIQFNKVPQYGLQQVKNMFEENLKHQVQSLNDNQSLIETYDRLYKPTYTIEFNREGEVVIYQCDPLKHSTIYFKYPYIFYESLIPASIYLFLMNPLEIAWYWNNAFAFLPFVLYTPRLWYYKNLSERISKMSLLRGGKVVRVESQTVGGDRNQSYVEIYNFRPLNESFQDFDDRDEADFLEEEGGLKYELACQLDNYQEQGCNVQDKVIYFMKQGLVYHPELFEAVCKGYHVDTSNYTINTANNLRSREGNHNH